MKKLQERVYVSRKTLARFRSMLKRLFTAFYNDLLESNLPMFNVISLVKQEAYKAQSYQEFREIRIGNVN